jgi:hypothetical protein
VNEANPMSQDDLARRIYPCVLREIERLRRRLGLIDTLTAQARIG